MSNEDLGTMFGLAAGKRAKARPRPAVSRPPKTDPAPSADSGPAVPANPEGGGADEDRLANARLRGELMTSSSAKEVADSVLRPDVAENVSPLPATSPQSSSRVSIMVYPPEDVVQRFSQYATDHQMTRAQLALTAVAAIEHDLEEHFRSTQTGLFGDLDVYTPRTQQKKKALNLRLLPQHLEVVDQLVERTPGCSSRSALFSTAIEVYLSRGPAK